MASFTATAATTATATGRGSAVSTDLAHWQDIPVTGPQADPGSAAFYSGSAVVDKDNTSGFGTPGNPAMVAWLLVQVAEQGLMEAFVLALGGRPVRVAGDRLDPET